MASKDQFTKFDDWAQLSDCKDYLDTMDKEVKDIFMLIQQKTREADDHIRVTQATLLIFLIPASRTCKKKPKFNTPRRIVFAT